MSSRRRATLIALAALLAWSIVPVAASRAQSVPGITPVSVGGFGDLQNSYSWSMAWFNGKLYVGTARNSQCVENATRDFYFPGQGQYTTQPYPELTCPADKHDLDLRAEIWQFTPETGAWRRVYQSPQDLPNPRAPGKFVARDIGFRGMAVHRGPDGTEALYVGGVTADEYIPELAEQHPPRILRTTDGESFEPLAGGPGVIETAFGPQRPIGFRAMAVLDGRLFVTASGGLTGDGVILEVKDPASSSPAFVQVSPSNLQVFEIDVYNGRLYAGGGSTTTGYSVWRTDADGPPYTFTPIVTNGAGRGVAITSVVTMHEYRGRLYVGSSGWYSTLFPASELIRIDPDDRWDLVVGNPRFTADGAFKFPVSGLPDGFGNIFNAHFWRQQTHGGALYLGTNDWSWALRGPWLDWLLGSEYGYDVYGTCDGQYWWPVTRNAFGDGLFNFGARTMASTPAGGFIGSANHIRGTAVVRSTTESPCAPPAPASSPPSSPPAAHSQPAPVPAPPRRLLTDVQRCGNVLTWDRSPRARRYRIRRAKYRRANVSMPAPRRLSGGFTPDLPPALGTARGRIRRGGVPVRAPFKTIGTTRRTWYIDRTARPGVRYAYEVVAELRSGRTSRPSNLVVIPSRRPATTFREAQEAMRRLAPANAGADLRRTLTAARGRWDRADRAGSVRRLADLRGSMTRTLAHASRADRPLVEDAEDTVMRLERRLRFTGVCGGGTR